MSEPSTNSPLYSKLATILGGSFLVLFVLGSWLPQPCPIVKNWIIGCPNGVVQRQLTPQEQELGRYTNQPITADFAAFSVTSQSYRQETSVRFAFWAPDSQIIYLQVKAAEGYHDLALVNHPILRQLSWPSVSVSPYRLYQKNTVFSTITDFVAHIPSPEQVLADRVAAKQYGLPDGSYTPLDPLQSLPATANYLLTSYTPITKDGAWNLYNQTFDLQAISPSASNKLEFMLLFPNHSQAVYLSTVHIDFHQINP